MSGRGLIDKVVQSWKEVMMKKNCFSQDSFRALQSDDIGIAQIMAKLIYLHVYPLGNLLREKLFLKKSCNKYNHKYCRSRSVKG